MSKTDFTTNDAPADFGKGLESLPDEYRKFVTSQPEGDGDQSAGEASEEADQVDDEETLEDDDVVNEETDVDADTDSDDEADEGSDDDEAGTGDESAAPSFGPSDRELAELYGLSDELDQLKTPEALHAAIGMLKRRGVKPNADVSAPSNSGDAGGEGAEAQTEADALERLFGIKAFDASKFEAKDEDGEYEYNEETRELANQLRQTQDVVAKIAAQAETNAQAQADDVAGQFHDYLDRYPKLYGTSIKDGTPVKLERAWEDARKEVAEAADTIHAGYLNRGVTPPPIEKIVEQAARMVHGDQLTKSAGTEAKPKSERLKEQSRRRRTSGSSGATRREAPPEPTGNEAKDIANHPSIRRAWNRMQEENGA